MKILTTGNVHEIDERYVVIIKNDHIRDQERNGTCARQKGNIQ